MLTLVVTPYEKGQLLNDEKYQEAIEEHGTDVKAGMGAEAIKELLSEIELQKDIYRLEKRN